MIKRYVYFTCKLTKSNTKINKEQNKRDINGWREEG